MAIIGSAYVEIKALTNKLEKEIQRALAKINDKFVINVDANTAAAVSNIETAIAGLSDDVSIDVDVNTDGIREQINAVSADATAHIDVSADTSSASAAISAVASEAESANPEIAVGASTVVARTRILAAARDRFATIWVDAKTSKATAKIGTLLAALSGGRVLGNYVEKITKHMAKLDKLVPGIAKIGTIFGTIAGMILTSVAGLVTLGAALGTIVNMMGIVAPGMIAGFATGIGVLIVALTDFKDQLPDVVEQYKTLGQAIKVPFWDIAREPIREMANKLFPDLKFGIERAAISLGYWTSELANSVKASLTTERLDTMFGFLTKSIDIASGAISKNVESLTVLGIAGGSVLPRLAGWWVDVSTQFNNFITAASADGRLDRWINDGITNLKELGGVIGNLGGIFANINEAAKAAGSDGLTNLLNGLRTFKEITDDAGVQGNLTTIFEGAAILADGFTEALARLFGGIGDMAPALKSAFSSVGDILISLSTAVQDIMQNDAFQVGFTAMFDGLQKGFDTLAPVIGTLGPKFGEIGTIVGLLAENLGGVLGKALEVALPLIMDLGEAIEPLIPVLGDLLISAIEALAPVFESLGSALLELSPVLVDLFAVLGQSETLFPGVTFVLDALVTVIREVVIPIIEYFVAILETVSAVITGDFAGALEGLKRMLSSMGDALVGIFDSIVDIVRNFVALFGGDFDSFIADTKANWEKFWTGLGIVVDAAWADVISFLATNIQNIENYFTNLSVTVILAWNIFWDSLSDKVNSIFTTIAVAVSTGFTKVQNEFDDIIVSIIIAWDIFWNGLITTVNTKIAEIATFFTSSGDAITTAWDEIWTKVAVATITIIQNLQDFFSPITNFFDALFTGTSVLIIAIWEETWRAVTLTITGAWTNIVSFITPIVISIQTTISNVLLFISTVWTNTWNAVVLGFTTVWDSIVNKVTLVVSVIQMTIDNFLAQVTLVWNTGWALISSFITTTWDTIVATVTPIIVALQTIITTTVTNIQTTWDAGWTVISNKVSAIWSTITTAVSIAINSVSTSVTNGVNTVKNTWNAGWDVISGKVSSIMSTVQSAIQVGVSSIQTHFNAFVAVIQLKVGEAVSFVEGLPAKILAGVGNLGTTLYSAGADLINGLTAGMSSMFESLTAKAREIGSSVANTVKSFFGIKSPSRMFRFEIGQQLGAGLVQGLDDSIAPAVKAASLLAKAATPDISDININRPDAAASIRGLTGSNQVSSGSNQINTNNNANQSASGGSVQINVHPSQGMSEEQIGQSVWSYASWQLENRLH